MPIPEPQTDETQDEFMDRCPSVMYEETDPGKSDEERSKQAYAMCMSQWRRAHGGEPPEGAMRGAEVIDLITHRSSDAGYSFKAAKRQAELLIYGEIGDELFGGVSAKQVVSDLKKAGRLDQITVRLHSPGGDIFDGVAIYNALMNHAAPVAVYVDGLAASAASIIAMAGKPINMAESGIMMLHEPWHITIGSADDMRAAADVLDKLSATMAGIYGKRTGKGLDQARAWMRGEPPAHETWFDLTEAQAVGLVDGAIEQPIKAAAHWDIRAWRKRFRNAPDRLFEQPEQQPGTPVSDYASRFRHAEMTLGRAK